MIYWKTIKNFSDYEISSTGIIKSNKYKAPLYLKPRIDKNGYLLITLYKNGKGYTKKIHRVVGYMFLPIPPKDKVEINHLDGNKKNNNYLNLEWVNKKENHRHARISGFFKNAQKKHSLDMQGNKNPMFGKTHSVKTKAKMRKLTGPEIIILKKLFAQKVSPTKISKKFNICRQSVYNIANRLS